MRLWIAFAVVGFLVGARAEGRNVGGYPRRLVWSGTIMMNGSASGAFVARTYLRYGRDIGPEYDGYFGCRGPGCVARRGHVYVNPLSPTTVNDFFFSYRKGKKRYYCPYVNDAPPPDFAVNGPVSCFFLNTEPQPVVATGTLALSVRRSKPTRNAQSSLRDRSCPPSHCSSRSRSEVAFLRTG